MLTNIVSQLETAMNHPLTLLSSFIFALIGFITWINSVRVKSKTKKENDEFQEKNRLVINELAAEYKARVATTHLNKINQEITKAEEKLEQKLPYQLEKAVIEQKILIEETLILGATDRLEQLKKQQIGDAKTIEQKGLKLFFFLTRFIISMEAKNITILLSIITAISLFSYILLPTFIHTSIILLSLITFILYVEYLYKIMEKEIVRDLFLYISGLLVSAIGMSIIRNLSNFIPLIISIIIYIYFARNHSKRKVYFSNVILIIVGFVFFAMIIGILILNIQSYFPFHVLDFLAIPIFGALTIMTLINMSCIINLIYASIKVTKK